MATSFPTNEKSYAVVLAATTSIEKVRTVAQQLKRSDPDNIAIWSVEPFDATQGPNWADIESTLNAIARKKTVVEQITQQDLVVAAEKISVLNQCT